MKKFWAVIFCIGLFTCTTQLAMAQGSETVELQVEHVSLFKNGLGYFQSTATLPEKSSSITLVGLPVPSLGTFWVGYPKSVQMKGLFTSMEEVSDTSTAQNFAQLLSVNVGRKVSISIGAKESEVIKGTIVATDIPKETKELPSPYSMNTGVRSSTGYTPVIANWLAIIKTERGNVALNCSSIIRVDFEDGDIKTVIPAISKKPRIRIELEKPAGGQTIGISYLTRGITWSPSYLIDLSDPKKAVLTANALIINEVADLKNASLDLVTGFPNIQFADISSPIAMTQSLADFLNALGRGRSTSQDSLMTQNFIMSNVERGSGRSVMPGYSAAAAGIVSEDLFFYPVTTKLNLKRGETAYVPLFTAEVPYEHIYIWKIPDFINSEARYQSSAQPGGQEPAEEVWHSCRLTNNMKMPWTTAPAEFVESGNFTGQDICYYTASGTQTVVRLNKALNISAEQAEVEIERKRDAFQLYGYHFDLVKVKGELKLRSRIDKPVNMEITKLLSGEVREISPKAKDTITTKGIKAVNQQHALVWNIELKPGEEQIMAYVYEVYIRQ